MLKQETGVRKQFLIVDDEVLLAFVKKGQKFAECKQFTEVSADVSCKVSSFCKMIYSSYLFTDHEGNFWTFKC